MACDFMNLNFNLEDFLYDILFQFESNFVIILFFGKQL